MATEHRDRFFAAGRARDHFDVGLARQDQGNPLPDDPMIVDTEHPDT